MVVTGLLHHHEDKEQMFIVYTGSVILGLWGVYSLVKLFFFYNPASNSFFKEWKEAINEHNFEKAEKFKRCSSWINEGFWSFFVHVHHPLRWTRHDFFGV